MVLSQIAPLITHEDDFITDFLQINDAALTFADYMGLDNYFRRQAARSSGISQSTMKLVRGALELIFSFLPAELKSWLDEALAKDKMYVPTTRSGSLYLKCLQAGVWSSCMLGTVYFRHRRDGGELLARCIGQTADAIEGSS